MQRVSVKGRVIECERDCVRERERERKLVKDGKLRGKCEKEREEHLLASAYCVFVTQGEIVTT